MSALSERIDRANHQGWKSRKVAELANDAGFTLSNGTAHLVLTGRHGNVNDHTLRALGVVFDIPFDELRMLAGHTKLDEPYVAPDISVRLSTAQRRLVDALIHQLARPRHEEEPQPAGRADADVLDELFDNGTSEPGVPDGDGVAPDADAV